MYAVAVPELVLVKPGSLRQSFSLGERRFPTLVMFLGTLLGDLLPCNTLDDLGVL